MITGISTPTFLHPSYLRRRFHHKEGLGPSLLRNYSFAFPKVSSFISTFSCASKMLLSEITLFRVNLPRKFSFFRDHPLSGPGYGDFCDQKKWTTSGSTTLTVRRPIELTSPDVAPCLSIKLQEFEAPEMASEATDLKLESMYKAPWAIPDPEPVVLDLETFINDTINCGLGLHVFNIACPIEVSF